MSQKLSEEEKKAKATRPKRSDAERREAARWARILRVYGLTKEQYDELDLGYCYVCDRPWSDTVIPCIDHDHSTGQIRGILCRYCNHRVVGRHRDSSLLRRIADYLDRPLRGWSVPVKKKKKRKKNGKSRSVRK